MNNDQAWFAILWFNHEKSWWAPFFCWGVKSLNIEEELALGKELDRNGVYVNRTALFEAMGDAACRRFKEAE